MSRVTIKDVAREAGVSASAVSRVFTEGGSASSQTREKVMAAAERLGYRPSLLARGLVRNRTNLITLVTGRMNDPFDALFLDQFSESLAERGTHLLLASAGPSGEAGLLQALDYQSDAVVVSAGTMSLEHSELCVRAGLPIILAGRVMAVPGVDCVLADNSDGGRQAAELLRRVGCRRLAYLGRGGATFSDGERWQGYKSAAAAAGLTVTNQIIEGRDDTAAAQGAAALLSRDLRPDGVFCSNDSIAIAALETARALGLKVPDELSIVGFNNIPTAARRSFRLTTLNYPVKRVVQGILALLDSRLDDPRRADEVRRIPTQLVVRGTTRQHQPEDWHALAETPALE
ncbi:LacI family DNA-binding transcriptional regulator [Pelagibius sp.]|uniref:LacI family DNA-binding transcriptional regulator n=1 Tax=Pelagibius sp. TaxID=1931238 RepID=UPI00261A41AD|nr:LacI family DNA-binding transcriptional regulator [Pelagibius sp.]